MCCGFFCPAGSDIIRQPRRIEHNFGRSTYLRNKNKHPPPPLKIRCCRGGPTTAKGPPQGRLLTLPFFHSRTLILIMSEVFETWFSSSETFRTLFANTFCGVFLHTTVFAIRPCHIFLSFVFPPSNRNAQHIV